jgi:hypothetical protein
VRSRGPHKTLITIVMSAAAFSSLWIGARVHAASILPKVVLSADSLAPRPIEQRTGEAITHDYAQAWQDLTDCLRTNRASLLSDYFAGQAKLRLTRRINEQRRVGLRTEVIDRGHRVRAVFYSLDGGEMQLEDQVQLEIATFDGKQMVYSGLSAEKYLVLMTPGADRWYVRSLQSVREDAF